MHRIALAAFLAAGAGGVLAQAVPNGTYQFISGPGLGNPAFTVTGGIPAPGGSVVGAHLPFCSGLHVHGVFNGFADPASGGCGHGIIQLVVPPPSVSGGGSSGSGSGLPGGAPNNVAGQLALTQPSSSVLNGPGFGDFSLTPIINLGSPSSLRTDLRLDIAMTSDFSMPPGSTGRPTLDLSELTAQTLLREPAQRVLTSPLATSWLEDFAAFRDRDADGHRREAERTRAQAEEWRKLADDARRDAERNRQRAEDARRDGREGDAADWDKEAERDETRAEERDEQAERLDEWSDEQRQREENARRDAQERRDAAEREREKARQAERDRADRVRREAEEKARIAREEREARRAKEAADREARRQAAEDRERARQREITRQREAREREHRARLDAEQRERDLRARGSSSDADLAKAAADRKKKEEEEASLLDRFADLVISVLDGNSETPEEKLLKAAKEKLEEKLKEEAMKRTGLDKVKEQLQEELASKLDDLGLDAAAGKLGEGVETLKKIKEIGDWMNAELDKNAGRQRRQMSMVEMLSDPKSRPERLRGASSGTIAGRDVLDVYKGAVEILK